MALQYLLGAIDLVGALSLGALVLGYPLPGVQAASALALIFKGMIFINDILSVVDIVLGVAMFWLLWQANLVAALSIAVYLAFKGAYTYA